MSLLSEVAACIFISACHVLIFALSLRMMWDEWFCWFSRDTESGQLFYMNKAVD